MSKARCRGSFGEHARRVLGETAARAARNAIKEPMLNGVILQVLLIALICVTYMVGDLVITISKKDVSII